MRRRGLLAASAVALCGSGLATAQEAAAGRVAKIEGSAALVRAGGTVPLAVGAEVRRGDTVRTAADGKVRIDTDDGLAIVVGPGSEVKVSDYVRSRGGLYGVEVLLSLVSGIVRLVGPAQAGQPRRVDVLTRVAVASVRSTDWLVDETAAGTGVFAREGRVEVTSLSGGTVFLDPGFGTDVAPGRPPTPPARWGDARRERSLARTTL